MCIRDSGDVALVETVAHTQAAVHFYPDTDVIVDVGGQDIKLIILDQGRVTDFKLNTQCSAGNGYFLQSTAQGFGYAVEDFADIAFSAKQYPTDVYKRQSGAWSSLKLSAQNRYLMKAGS